MYKEYNILNFLSIYNKIVLKEYGNSFRTNPYQPNTYSIALVTMPVDFCGTFCGITVLES